MSITCLSEAHASGVGTSANEAGDVHWVDQDSLPAAEYTLYEVPVS